MSSPHLTSEVGFDMSHNQTVMTVADASKSSMVDLDKIPTRYHPSGYAAVPPHGRTHLHGESRAMPADSTSTSYCTYNFIQNPSSTMCRD